MIESNMNIYLFAARKKGIDQFYPQKASERGFILRVDTKPYGWQIKMSGIRLLIAICSFYLGFTIGLCAILEG